MYIHTYIHILFITGRLPWQPVGIKFTQWVSGQESAFSPLHERTMRWIEKNDWHLRNCHDVLYQHAKFWEIELRVPAAGTKIGVFCMSRLVCLRVGDIVPTSIVWRFMGRFFMRFSTLFQNGLFFQMHYIVLMLDGATIFAKLQSKIVKSPKIGGKVCAHHFV